MKHHSDKRVLDRRTLEQDHRMLATLLRPGMRVLDVGCGTGAITAGIARAVGPGGMAVGVDRDAQMRSSVRADATALPFDSAFDIVTAARTLQWIADPARAVASMAAATRHGGVVVVLDYNHANNEWDPTPPEGFLRFYRAFLGWREANGWDNRMADRLPELFAAAGLKDVQSYDEDESATRGEPGFEASTAIWAHVIESVGLAITNAGFAAEADLADAAAAYRPWVETTLRRQTLQLRAVVGCKT